MSDHVTANKKGGKFDSCSRPIQWTIVCFVPLLLATVFGLVGCAGYHLGSIGGKNLQGINTIFIPTVKNLSYEPDIQVTTTNAIIRAMDNDGTLKTVPSSTADADLLVTVTSTKRESIRGNTLDPQATEEYELHVEAEVTLFSRKLSKKLLDKVKVEGVTKFFVQSDQTESERQAYPMAAEDLANHIVSLVVEGW